MTDPGFGETAADYLRDRLHTLGIVALLLVWYDLQIVTAALFDFTVSDVQYWFKITSLTDPSPGWLLAVISHGFPPHYDHLLANCVGVMVFGGAMERHLSRRELLGFFVVVGVGSLFAQIAYGIGVDQRYAVNGASGAVVGFTTMYGVHYVLAHRDVLELPDRFDSPRAWFHRTRTVFAYLGPPSVLSFVAFQLVGVVPSGSSAVLSHLAGALAGVAIAVLRPLYARGVCAMA